MKSRLEKLLTIKSIISLILVLLFTFLAATGKISGDDVKTVTLMVIAFYFGTQKLNE